MDEARHPQFSMLGGNRLRVLARKGRLRQSGMGVSHVQPRQHDRDPPRPNRISVYAFNPDGGLGVGSYFQDTLQEGSWIFVVGVADSTRTYIYRDGLYRRCDTYRGPSAGPCPVHFQAAPNDNLQLEIDPIAGSAPLRLGTRDFNSFFEGGLSRLRIWNRALGADEITALYSTDTVPSDGLVAEFLLNADAGTTATDTAQGHNGKLFGATWDVQS